MSKTYKQKEELYNLDYETLERVVNLLGQWNDLPINEYQSKLDCLVESLLKIPFDLIPDDEDRNSIVKMITEEHFTLFGSYPKNSVLNRLGDFILLQYIKDRNKSKFEPNAFHTQKQTKRRMSKEYNTEADTMDFLNCKMNMNLSSLHRKTKKTVE